MALIYGNGIKSPMISRGEVGIPNPQKEIEKPHAHWDWSHPFSSLGSYIKEYVVDNVMEYVVQPELEFVFGGGHSNAFTDFVGQINNTILGLPVGILDLTDSVASLMDGQSDYSAGTIGHTMLQATALGLAFVPGAGPLLSGAIMAADTTWSTVDLAESGNGSWQDYTIMWGATAAAVGFGAKGTIKEFKTASQLKELGATSYSRFVEGPGGTRFIKGSQKDIGRFVSPKQLEKIKQGATGVKGDFKAGFREYGVTSIDSIKFVNKMESKGLSVNPKDISEAAKIAFKDIKNFKYASKTLSADESAKIEKQRQKERDLLEEIRSKLPKKNLIEFEVFIRNIRGRSVLSRAVRNTVFLRKVSLETRIVFKEAYGKVFGKFSERKGLVIGSGQPTGFWRQFKSSSFYQNETQFFQDLAGTDAGRQGVEVAYAWFRHGGRGKYFINENGLMDYRPPRWKGLDKTLEEKGWGKIAKNLNKAEELEKGFVKSGGTVIKSKYLLGYKVLVSTPLGLNKAQMHFRTGKLPIIIDASDKDLLNLVEQGSSYWFAIGQSRGWFMSRGGKNAGPVSATGLVSKILAIMPVQVIRTFGSMLHNVKDVQNALREEGFGYFSTWSHEFVSAFTNTLTNRVGRSLTAGVVGVRYGKWAGRASQQFGTALINSVVPKVGIDEKTGGFTIKKTTNFHTAMFGSGKSQFSNTLVGKRIQSDLKTKLQRKTGVRFVGGQIRKGKIYGSTIGHGTNASKGWAGGWGF